MLGWCEEHADHCPIVGWTWEGDRCSRGLECIDVWLLFTFLVEILVNADQFMKPAQAISWSGTAQRLGKCEAKSDERASSIAMSERGRSMQGLHIHIRGRH